jgi:hypothetical protein
MTSMNYPKIWGTGDLREKMIQIGNNRLHPEERQQLLSLVKTRRAAAPKLLHARILLTVDVDAGGRHWAASTTGLLWRLLRLWTPAPLLSLGCVRHGTKRIWMSPCPTSAPLVGSIAHWVALKRPS